MSHSQELTCKQPCAGGTRRQQQSVQDQLVDLASQDAPVEQRSPPVECALKSKTLHPQPACRLGTVRTRLWSSTALRCDAPQTLNPETLNPCPWGAGVPPPADRGCARGEPAVDIRHRLGAHHALPGQQRGDLPHRCGPRPRLAAPAPACSNRGSVSRTWVESRAHDLN